MQSNGNIILVGIKISETLRHQLNCCKTSFKPFFADNDPEFLQVIEIESNEYIAKTTKSGVTLEDLANMSMNLRTMLKLICPKFSFDEDTIRIMALSPINSNIHG